MFDRKLLWLAALVPLFALAAQPAGETNLIEGILQNHPAYFSQVLDQIEKYEVQILYTQVDRDEDNNPAFTSHRYRLDPAQYFYPASTVKLPAAVVALEKLNQLDIPQLTKFTAFRIDSAYSRQTAVVADSSAPGGLPTIANYIKKIFLVSDNDAYNRLYEFIGQQALNESLWAKGFTDLRIIHRLSYAASPEENRYTNPFTFYGSAGVIYEKPLVYSELEIENSLQGTLKGQGYMSGGELVETPMDFSHRNFISIENLQGILKAVVFPAHTPPDQRFDLKPEDYDFLLRYLSMLPRESEFSAYRDSSEYYDSYCKFFMFGDSKERMPHHIRIFNKIGMAYGFLTDNAYIVDYQNNIEFFLTAVIYVNENGVLNDNDYEYDEIGIPFLANLGRVIHRYEVQRQRSHAPDLSRFRLDDSRPE